jgi:predicted DNA-binding WGR domain protein
MSQIYEWLNIDKGRYYKIVVVHDGADINLNYRWGGCNSNRGGAKSVKVQSPQELEAHIDRMMKRRKSRGYRLISSTIH